MFHRIHKWNCQAFQNHPWTFHSGYQSSLQISPSHFHWGYLKEDKKFILLRFYVKSVLVNMDHNVEKRWFYSYVRKIIIQTINDERESIENAFTEYFFFLFFNIYFNASNQHFSKEYSSLHLHSETIVILSMRKYANTIHKVSYFQCKSQNITLFG